MSATAKPQAARKQPDRAVMFDNSLRWWVASRRDPREKHLVELGGYYPRCGCAHFCIRLEPVLRRRTSHPKDYDRSFYCHHIEQALIALGEAVSQKLTESEKH
jgi:hypothetical protein